MYNKSVVAIIRRILETQNDREFLPMLAEVAVDEIERLAKELEYERTRGIPGGNQWLQP